jgi:hypothetical protein
MTERKKQQPLFTEPVTLRQMCDALGANEGVVVRLVHEKEREDPEFRIVPVEGKILPDDANEVRKLLEYSRRQRDVYHRRS